MAKVLVVDDDRVNRILLTRFLESSRHAVCAVDSGEAAVDVFPEFEPDVVLLDVVMPGMDGFEATRRIKHLSAGRHVPILLLTALTDEESLVRGISAGADDFISKPVNRVVLNSRLHASLRTQRLFGRLAAQHGELQARQRQEERELALAERLLSSMVRSEALEDARLRCFSRALTLFNGDLLLARHTPSRRLRVMLGDFAGHGLHAAIGSMPVAVMFQQLTEDGRDLRSTFEHINERLLDSLPTELFLAAGALELSADGRSVEIWNCGMPELLIISDTGDTRTFSSHALPLGITTWDRNAVGSLVDVAPHDRIYLFSDGLLEVTGPDGSEFGMERILAHLKPGAEGPGGMDALLGERTAFMKGRDENDDVTLVQIRAEPEDSEPGGVEAKPRSRLTLELGPDALRALDCGGVVENLVGTLPLPPRDRSHVGTILTELVSNGLDHGVLGLESGLKSTARGFDAYHARRAEALRRLERGHLAIELAVSLEDACTRVWIQVRDSGSGFDVESPIRDVDDRVDIPWGRGLAIVESLSERLSILGRGNVVEAEYATQHDALTPPEPVN
jgi:DNA-binding response OmpR family regulator